MIEIIENARVEYVTVYERVFDMADEPGSGFAFNCDEHGVVQLPRNEAAMSNYQNCKSGEIDVVDKGVRRWDRVIKSPAIGRCACRKEVVLDDFTNPCECGRDYDHRGMLLAPRSQWGEETGEHPADVARISWHK